MSAVAPQGPALSTPLAGALRGRHPSGLRPPQTPGWRPAPPPDTYADTSRPEGSFPETADGQCAAGYDPGRRRSWRLARRPLSAMSGGTDGLVGPTGEELVPFLPGQECQTARLLDRLGRDGYVVFHDLALPDSPANL